MNNLLKKKELENDIAAGIYLINENVNDFRRVLRLLRNL